VKLSYAHARSIRPPSAPKEFEKDIILLLPFHERYQ